jgi:hypothetical protein
MGLLSWKRPGSLAGALALLCVCLASRAPAGEGLPSHLDRAVQKIDGATVYGICKKLASPDFSGRLTGDGGYTGAARWMAGLMQGWGLKPMGDAGSYLQAFPMQYTTVQHCEMVLFPPPASGRAPEEIRLEPGKDFLPLMFSDTGNRTAEIVFAGWGVSAPELGYDDYEGIDIRGKFVMCFRGTPDPADSRYTNYDEHRTRMAKASEKGALGILYIYEDPIANPNGDWIRDFTPAVVSRKTADTILGPLALNSDSLKADLRRYKRPLSFSTSMRVRLEARTSHVPQGTGYNVIGVLPGSDPALRNEYVVVGGHADHCGTIMNLMFPGANDNASGTATVLEIARTLGDMPQKPRRSLVFVLFGAEESGLKGSEFFASHLPFGRGAPVAMLNFDMVGEGEGIGCGYSDGRPELQHALELARATVGTLRGTSAISGVGVQGSDYAPFFQRGIPCLSFSSNGPHLEYHRTGDTIYRINPDILADAARIGLIAAYSLADR